MCNSIQFPVQFLKHIYINVVFYIHSTFQLKQKSAHERRLESIQNSMIHGQWLKMDKYLLERN
jgi:hypothetical protein